jgi:hypothetical protein
MKNIISLLFDLPSGRVCRLILKQIPTFKNPSFSLSQLADANDAWRYRNDSEEKRKERVLLKEKLQQEICTLNWEIYEFNIINPYDFDMTKYSPNCPIPNEDYTKILLEHRRYVADHPYEVTTAGAILSTHHEKPAQYYGGDD